METLPHWTGLLPLAGLALTAWAWAWAQAERREQERAADRRHLGLVPEGPRPEPRPYEPTEADWAEYHAWREETERAEDNQRRDKHNGGDPICPADFGEPCEDCDREQAEAWAARHEPADDGDGWYADLVKRAMFPSFPWKGGDF